MNKVVFVALTSYQLFVSDGYARYISRKLEDADVVILYSGPPHPKIREDGKYRIVDIRDLNTSKVKRFWRRLIWGRLYCLNPYRRLLRTEGKTWIFAFNDTDPVTNKIIVEAAKRKERTISLIEEGIGIYETQNLSINPVKKGIRLAVTWLMGSPMQYRAVGDNALIDNAIVENREVYLHLSKAAGQNVLGMHKKSLFGLQSDFIRRMEDTAAEIRHCDIMYLGQTFDAFGRLNEYEDAFLSSLFSIIQKTGKTCIIKPHPLDAPGKYGKYTKEFGNLSVIEGFMAALPVECMTLLISAGTVITFNSSAGLNLANSYEDIRAIFTFDMPETGKLYEIWSNGYAELNRDAFQNEYGNICLPKTMDELGAVLSGTAERDGAAKQEAAPADARLEEMDAIFRI